MAKTTISITIDGPIYLEARKNAKADNRSVSNYIETAVAVANKKLKPKTTNGSK